MLGYRQRYIPRPVRLGKIEEMRSPADSRGFDETSKIGRFAADFCSMGGPIADEPFWVSSRLYGLTPAVRLDDDVWAVRVGPVDW